MTLGRRLPWPLLWLPPRTELDAAPALRQILPWVPVLLERPTAPGASLWACFFTARASEVFMLLGAVVAAATQLSVVRCNVIHRDGGAILWVSFPGMNLALAVEALRREKEWANSGI